MNILIVGGGTAGWLTALFLTKNHPDHTYTLVESSSMGVIGTGEGSTGALTGVVFNQLFATGGSPQEFVRATGARPKLGIKFKGWVASEFYSPVDGSLLNEASPDPLMLNSIVYDIPAHLATRHGVRLEHGLTPFTNVDTLSWADAPAWHFDGVKVGQYFKSLCPTVTSIDAQVTDITRTDTGAVASVALSTGRTLQPDLVIDCSGFNSLFRLSDEAVVDRSPYLPVNTALPFHMPLTQDVPLYTQALALKHGWVWSIPVGDRMGCGYVFDRNHADPEQALAELALHFGPVEPIKQINFQSCQLAEPWKHNVIRLGLSGGFLEPLQATAIHTVIAQLSLLTFSLFRNRPDAMVNPANQIAFNRYSREMSDSFVDLINLHYKTGRTDSEFWRYMQTDQATTDRNREILTICQHRFPTVIDIPNRGFNAGINLLGPVIAGLGLVGKTVAAGELEFTLEKNPYDLRVTMNSMAQGVRESSPYNMADFLRVWR